MGKLKKTHPDQLLRELRDHRLRYGLSWKEFAAEIGISPTALWRIAHGRVVAADLSEHKIRRIVENTGGQHDPVAQGASVRSIAGGGAELSPDGSGDISSGEPADQNLRSVDGAGSV